MKKIVVLAAMAMLVGGGIAFANEGGKDKKKGEKAKTEDCVKKCTKPCTKPPCCDKSKCKKS
ncbi:hypothetical protein LZZ85_16695 [Terrimonas sp. NA20]|uniref:Uncharacterized protein n=1 Tax=Terrimonas ginsenosidimutans TaxID=2908004 RepID=A0ABS9KUB7_9BACT|nr:hypothetical protein [Terrimonas ginsenosidimutans]MCG2615937.1 hypothetical protein [Terrimonas ginsenosidimutans]